MASSAGNQPSSTSTAADDKNPRGIPKAPFIVRSSVPSPVPMVLQFSLSLQTDVGSFLGSYPSAAVAIKSFQDALAKYRYMEANLTQRKSALEEKIPDIRKTLSMVEFLDQRRVRILDYAFRTPC
jgi:hypothetical protein